MCFSATASFVAAAMTGAIGIVPLARVNERGSAPLAAIPLFFSAQQSIEGVLWLTLPLAPETSTSTGLTLLFLFLAEVFWPIYAPIAAMLVEPRKGRRLLIYLCGAVGVGVAGYLFWHLLYQPHDAAILNGHIVYIAQYEHTNIIVAAYLTATALPLLLSSQRTVVAVGATILAGYAVAFIFYWEAFVSVWCFFAAAASLLILFHFESVRRQSLLKASA
jgi:hypothetical protein